MIAILQSWGVYEAQCDAWQATGFYAIADRIDSTSGFSGGLDSAGLNAGDTVISYRGTDDSADYWRGWLTGAGLAEPFTEVDEAPAFDKAETDQH